MGITNLTVKVNGDTVKVIQPKWNQASPSKSECLSMFLELQDIIGFKDCAQHNGLTYSDFCESSFKCFLIVIIHRYF